MAYNLPSFNLTMDVWAAGTPNAGPPDYTSIPCQKYVFSKTDVAVTPPWAAGYWSQWHPAVLVRTPRIFPFANTIPVMLANTNIVELPVGSLMYYLVRMVEIVHEGFPNEYTLLVVVQCDDTGNQLPPVTQ